MYDYSSGFLGMHFVWWFFWFSLWVLFFLLMRPVPRKHFERMRESPIEILNRRLAMGEINEQFYQSRKAIIDQNSGIDSGERQQISKGRSVKSTLVKA